MRCSGEEMDIIRKTLEYSAAGSTHLEPDLLKNPYPITPILLSCREQNIPVSAVSDHRRSCISGDRARAILYA